MSRQFEWPHRLVMSACAALALAAAPYALAHDFWVQPSSFTPAPDAPLKIQLRVGDVFPGDIVPRNDERIVQFALIAPQQAPKPIVGRDGSETAGLARIGQRGLHIIAYRSAAEPVTLEAEKFEHYLRDKGLEHIISARADKQQTTAPGREIYSRCAKALVQAGATAPEDGDRAVGLRLELVALKNPYTLTAGEDLPLQLLFEGQPCPGRLVVARSPDHPDLSVSARSDQQGRVALKLPEGGTWMITAVHMMPAPPEKTTADFDADWESLWASLSFAVPAAKAE